MPSADIAGPTHPLAAMLAAELQKWAASAEYAAVLAGDYPRRSADASSPMSEDVRAAAATYSSAVTSSADPLVKIVGKVGGVGGAARAGSATGGRAGPLGLRAQLLPDA